MWDKNIEKIKTDYVALTNSYLHYEEFNLCTISSHSVGIEGGTLNPEDTYYLYKCGETATRHQLYRKNEADDHLNALIYMMKLAEKKHRLTISDLKDISSLILKKTGVVHNGLSGYCNETTGDFRKGTSLAGPVIFMNYLKVPISTLNFVEQLRKDIDDVKNPEDIYKLSFKAHFDLVNIHPFGNGNGRLSRLVMNYVQRYHGEPLSLIFKENKSDYLISLNRSRNKNDLSYFYQFMFHQAQKYWLKEMDRLNLAQQKADQIIEKQYPQQEKSKDSK